jgi:hypothetical protein
MQAQLPGRRLHHLNLVHNPEHTIPFLEKLAACEAEYGAKNVRVETCFHGTESHEDTVKILLQGLRHAGSGANLPGVTHGQVYGSGVYVDRSSFDQGRGRHHKYGSKVGGSLVVLVIVCRDPTKDPDDVPCNPHGVSSFRLDCPVIRANPDGEWFVVRATETGTHMLVTGFAHHTEEGCDALYTTEMLPDLYRRSTCYRGMPVDNRGQELPRTGDPKRLPAFAIGPLIVDSSDDARLVPHSQRPVQAPVVIGRIGIRPRLTLSPSWADNNLFDAKPAAEPIDVDLDEEMEEAPRTIPNKAHKRSKKRAASPTNSRPGKRQSRDFAKEKLLWDSFTGNCRKACASGNPLPPIFVPGTTLPGPWDNASTYYANKQQQHATKHKYPLPVPLCMPSAPARPASPASPQLPGLFSTAFGSPGYSPVGSPRPGNVTQARDPAGTWTPPISPRTVSPINVPTSPTYSPTSPGYSPTSPSYSPSPSR